MSTVAMQQGEFQHIVRLLNTNVDGKRKVAFALRTIKGIGIRLAYLVVKKAGIDIQRRAGTLTVDETFTVNDEYRHVVVNMNCWLPGRSREYDRGAIKIRDLTIEKVQP